MRRFLGLTMLAATLLAPAVVLADPPSYKYLEGGFIDVEIDGHNASDFEDDGFFVGGSYGWKFIHVYTEYQDIGDYEAWNAGVGYNGLLGKKADLVVQITWQDLSIDAGPSPDIDDSGTIYTAGVRWQIIKILEINGFLNAPDISDFDEDYYWDVGAVFTFGPVGIGAGWESSNEDRDSARVFFRWMFGR